MSTWVIQDWTGQEIEDGFESFGDARARIDELATIEADNNYARDIEATAWEELYDGICEDLYAVNLDANGNVLPDAGQYSY